MFGTADDSPGEGRRLRVRLGREDLRLLHREVLRSRSHIPRLSNAADTHDETAGILGLFDENVLTCLEYKHITKDDRVPHNCISNTKLWIETQLSIQ